MNSNEKALTIFSTRVRQMILNYSKIKEENTYLRKTIDERDSMINQLTLRLTQTENDYNSLKMVRMIEVSDSDVERAEKRLSKLIKDINKCIISLSEK